MIDIRRNQEAMERSGTRRRRRRRSDWRGRRRGCGCGMRVGISWVVNPRQVCIVIVVPGMKRCTSVRESGYVSLRPKWFVSLVWSHSDWRVWFVVPLFWHGCARMIAKSATASIAAQKPAEPHWQFMRRMKGEERRGEGRKRAGDERESLGKQDGALV